METKQKPPQTFIDKNSSDERSLSRADLCRERSVGDWFGFAGITAPERRSLSFTRIPRMMNKATVCVGSEQDKRK